MKKILLLCLFLSSCECYAQVKQFYWKQDASGKAVPYVANGKNINLDSAQVYSKHLIDSMFVVNTPDTVTRFYTQYDIDSINTYNIFDPSKDYEFYEEFDARSTASIGRMGWTQYGAGVGGNAGGSDTTKTNVPSSHYIRTGTGANSYTELYSPDGIGGIYGAIVGNQAFTLKMRVRNLNPTVPQKRVYFGLMGDETPAIGIYFYCDSLAYRCVVNGGAGASDTLTTKLQTANWTTFKMVSTGSSIGFYVGDTLATTITAHIPTASLTYMLFIKTPKAEATIKELDIDYVWCKMKGLSR